jgi:peroxiredoxin
LWQTFKDRGVVVVGIDTGGLRGGDDAARVQAFVDQTGITFDVGWDRSQSYRSFLGGGPGISPFPLDVIIGPDAKIAYLSREYDIAAMREVVENLLKETSP